jgi:PmbA protein
VINNKQKDLARWSMDQCLKCGCQAVRVNIYSGTNTDFDIRNKQLDKLQQSSENQLIFNIYVDGKFGSFSTNRMEADDILHFIERAVESVRYLSPDTCRQLPDSSRYFKGNMPDLGLYDSRINDISPDEKLKITHFAADEIAGKDPRILSVQASYSDGESFSYTIASNGFEGESAHSYYSLSVVVSVKGEGDVRPEAFWYDQSLSWDDLQKSGIGVVALERALKKLGQQKVASGKYPMLVDNMNAGRLLGPVLSALNGGALQQKNSFLMDRKGDLVLSEKVTIIDNPHVPRSFGARYFDNEGVATKKRFIFKQGILETYFIDTYYGLKMELEPTISGISQLDFELGVRDVQEMIASIDRGILVTGFNGGNCNSSSGDFSYGIEGFLIENGHLTVSISEMNVTGNMLDLWNNVAEVGNDPRLNNAYHIPSLLFSDVDFSGL